MSETLSAKTEDVSSRKRGRKSVKENYFDIREENAVRNFLIADSFEEKNKIYNEFRKKALDLGVDIPKDVVNYKNEVFKFMENATAIHKKYLNIK